MAGVVFFGSPDFALPALQKIIPTPYRPSLVVTQPARPSGRGRKERPTPVHLLARENGLPVRVIDSFSDGEAVDEIRNTEPDFFVVVAFGLIFPSSILDIAAVARINLHASLLPAYRGASPVNMTLLNGDSFTGVTAMEMVRELDAGPIYSQEIQPIDPLENAGELTDKLALRGASLLLKTLLEIETRGLVPIEQPAEGISLAPKLRKKDGFIPWEKDVLAVHNHIRGMNPWPGSFTYYGGDYIKVHRARPVDFMPRPVEPGVITAVDKDNLQVACGRGALAVTELQAGGKRSLPAGEFLKGFPLHAGETLGGESR
ncbi:MAG: methionyl-tRNA formyltransferase [Candidatus Krumholzibacteriota bacterium]|nr:methionyl-tRNA formyltransferase [Candidatus Krumholzibacteriota bacterium]